MNFLLHDRKFVSCLFHRRLVVERTCKILIINLLVLSLQFSVFNFNFNIRLDALDELIDVLQTLHDSNIYN